MKIKIVDMKTFLSENTFVFTTIICNCFSLFIFFKGIEKTVFEIRNTMFPISPT
jgi:hypothetical protein